MKSRLRVDRCGFSTQHKRIRPSGLVPRIIDQGYPCPHPDLRKPSSAFTLVELLIVLSLIVLTMGLALPRFSSILPGVSLRAAARELASMIRYAEAKAKEENRDQSLVIDMDANRCSIERKIEHSFPRGIHLKVIDPFAGEVKRGTFTMLFPAGGGVEGGTVVLWNERKRVLLTPDPVAGSITVTDEKIEH